MQTKSSACLGASCPCSERVYASLEACLKTLSLEAYSGKSLLLHSAPHPHTSRASAYCHRPQKTYKPTKTPVNSFMLCVYHQMGAGGQLLKRQCKLFVAVMLKLYLYYRLRWRGGLQGKGRTGGEWCRETTYRHPLQPGKKNYRTNVESLLLGLMPCEVAGIRLSV